MSNSKRLFPTRSGKLVDISKTRADEHGVYGWQAAFDRKTSRYLAVAVFVPVVA